MRVHRELKKIRHNCAPVRYRFFDQRGHEELFPILNPLSSSNLVERSHYQIASPKKIPMENRSRAAPNAHVA
jgi:hypothetical protein